MISNLNDTTSDKRKVRECNVHIKPVNKINDLNYLKSVSFPEGKNVIVIAETKNDIVWFVDVRENNRNYYVVGLTDEVFYKLKNMARKLSIRNLVNLGELFLKTGEKLMSDDEMFDYFNISSSDLLMILSATVNNIKVALTLFRYHPINNLPNSWKWIVNVVDEARLPEMGLPVRIEKTIHGYTKKIFIPDKTKQEGLKPTGIIYAQESKSNSWKKQSKKGTLHFITSTKNKNPMPGTKTPAAVRYTRFQQMQDQGVLSEDFTGNELAPCIAHGDYVKVTDLASDHIDAKDRILNRQVELVNLLNTNPILAKIVMKLPGIEKFFIKKDLNTGEGEKYYGTLFFYELYFNDIDNLWLICHNCNSQKSDSDVADWFERQWLWSKDFFDFLCLEKEDKRLIRKKIKTQEGLAEVAINWFWEKHAGYIATTKKFYEEIKNPILLLNRKIDHIVGLGKLEKAQRYADELDFKIELMGAIIDTPGLREKGEDSSSDSDIFSYGSLSDTEDLPLPTSAEFRRARKRTIDEISDKVQKTLAYNVRAEKKTTKKPAKKAKLENLTPKESRNTNSNL